MQFTDKYFYLQRIKKEFVKNKEVVDEEELQKLFKVSILLCLQDRWELWSRGPRVLQYQ